MKIDLILAYELAKQKYGCEFVEFVLECVELTAKNELNKYEIEKARKKVRSEHYNAKPKEREIY